MTRIQLGTLALVVSKRYNDLSSFMGEVSELADEHDLGSCAERRRSSSLLFPRRAMMPILIMYTNKFSGTGGKAGRV